MATIDVTLPIRLNKRQLDQAVGLVEAWGATLEGKDIAATFVALIGHACGMCRAQGVSVDDLCEAIRRAEEGE